jgi:hypothetical protein
MGLAPNNRSTLLNIVVSNNFFYTIAVNLITASIIQSPDFNRIIIHSPVFNVILFVAPFSILLRLRLLELVMKSV